MKQRPGGSCLPEPHMLEAVPAWGQWLLDELVATQERVAALEDACVCSACMGLKAEPEPYPQEDE